MFGHKKAYITLADARFILLNKYIIKLYQTNRKIFYNNVQINAVSARFPYSIWSSCRAEKFLSVPLISKVMKFYIGNKISVDLIFDNEFIIEDDLDDTFSNIILKIAHNKNNSVTLRSNILSEYIKRKFPLYTIKQYADFENFNGKNIKVDPKYNNTDKLKFIKYKKEADIILNPICPSNCRYYDFHKKYLMKEQKGFYKKTKFFICPLNVDYCFYSLSENQDFISREKINEYLLNGFSSFVLDYPDIIENTHVDYTIADVIESYVYYLIKPEYKYEIRKDLMNIRLKAYTKLRSKNA